MTKRDDGVWVPAMADASEEAVIGLLIADPSVLDELLTEGLEPDHFGAHAFRMLFIAAMNLSERSEPIDAATMGREAERHPDVPGKYEPFELFETAKRSMAHGADIADPAHHARAIIQSCAERRMQDIARKLYRKLGDPSVAKSDVINEALDSFAQIRTTERLRPDGLSELVTVRVESIIAGRGAPVSTVRSGFSEFDTLTGGFRRGGLVVVAAPAGLGKSALTLQMATNIANATRQCVPIFSLEMDSDDIVNRAISQDTGFNTMLVHSGRLPWDTHDALREAVEHAKYANIRIDQTNTRTVPGIRAKCKAYAAKYGQLAAIEVDFIQLVSAGEETDGRETEIAKVSMGLKAIAKEMRCPVISISNMNRLGQKDNERPTRSSLRGSGQIESDADMIIFLWRERPAPRDEPEQIEWIIDKNRHGPTGSMTSLFDKTTVTYKPDEVRIKPPPDPPPPKPAPKPMRYGTRNGN